VPTSSALLTTVEVAGLLKVHPKQVYRLLRQGLPARRLGRGWRFVSDDVIAWMDGRSTPSGPPAQPAALQLPRNLEPWEARPGAPTDPPPLLAANGDLVIEILLAALNASAREMVGFVRADRATAIEWLEQGRVAAAGCHGSEPPTRLSAGRLVRLHLVEREIGLAYRDGFDRTRLLQLSPNRFAARPSTAGIHIHLLEWLSATGLDAASFLAGAPCHDSHQLVVEAIVRGDADAGFTTRAWASRLGLGFVASATESYGLLVRAHHLGGPLIVRLCDLTQSAAFQRSLARIPGYDPTGCGSIRYDPEPVSL